MGWSLQSHHALMVMLVLLALHGSLTEAGAGGKNSNAKFYGPGTQGNLELVTELSPVSFDTMKSGKKEWVVEFYAPWCPHCQHYKPEYGKVAGRISGMTCSGSAGSEHPVGIGAVNCVLEKALCQAEGIKSYPTVKRFDGSGASGQRQDAREPRALVAALMKSWGPCTEHTEEWIVEQAAAHKAASDAQVMANSSPILPGSEVQSHHSEETTAARRHDITEAVWFTFRTSIFAGRDTLSKLEVQALVDWLSVLVDLLPPGSGNDLIATSLIPLLLKDAPMFEEWDSAVSGAIVQLKERNPNSADGDGTAHEHLGEGGDWLYCADVGEHMRGYTCGLWTTFHTLSVRAAMQISGRASGGDTVPETSTPGQVALAIYGFITHFFACNDCREHFLAAHDKAEVRALSDRGNAVALWFWSAHNAVNSRLRSEKLAPTDGGTPMSPDAPWHMPFPSASDCLHAQPAQFYEVGGIGSCRSEAGGYNLDKVWRFLQSTYGFGATPLPDQLAVTDNAPVTADVTQSPAMKMFDGAAASSETNRGSADGSKETTAELNASGERSGQTIGIVAVLFVACGVTAMRLCTAKTDTKEGHGY